MPANKNAMTRYMILDGLLSNRYHDYSLDDLTEEVSRRLSELYCDTKGVVRRTIEKDIDYLENEGPFMAEIERRWVPCLNRETGKTTQKKCLRYKELGYSIFKKKLSDDEKYLLGEALSLLGQFDGLPNFEALEQLRQSLQMPDGLRHEPIILFTKNPLENSNLLGELFTAISQKQVIELHYHTFAAPDTVKQIIFHPYLLKEYNRRWYVIGVADCDGKILSFSLDRIDTIMPQTALDYIEPSENLAERFEDIIGVTYFDDSPIYQIVFWADDTEMHYIKTKPIHESQRNLTKEKAERLREETPSLKGGAFFRIDCKCNYELIRELASFGSGVIVLSPAVIRDKIIKRVKEMAVSYNC
ncbi:MAG: WYL domain-containing protein [Muribaculaceae bacterium]|nr:WYL domain-containing protein [Muribaculaceae bacterium]